MTSIGSGPGPVSRFDAGDSGVSTDSSGATGGLSSRITDNPELAAIAEGRGSIGLNSRGDAPRAVQQMLIELLGSNAVGRHGADGWWGVDSMAGLQRFQESQGLRGTGIVDKDTLIALDKALSGGGGSTTGDVDASTAMQRTLADAVADGKLGAAELQQAEADIAAKYGPDVAKQVLLESFGVHADKLEFDAVDFLQGRIGSMEGHIGRFQGLLDETLKGAKILDVNHDGQLDADDLVFTQGASGQVNVEKIGAARRDDLQIAKAMVDACDSMDEAGHDFALIKDHRANDDFWNVGSGGVFTLKDGVTPSDALQDIFNNPDEYGFECATAMVIVYYKAMHDLIGAEDFNRICGDLEIGPWRYENDLRSVKDIAGDGQAEGTMTGVRPGEYRYIRNWDVSDEGRAAGWQGENVIYMGNGNYYGHPFGKASAESIISYLNGHRNAGSTRSASMTGLTGLVNRRILDFDQN